MNTLTLQEAADLLKIHPTTLQIKARIGEIPGARIGKRWVFVHDDLIDHVRAQYSPRALQGDKPENVQCRSTSARIHLTGGSSCPTTAARYNEALGLPTAKRRGSTPTSPRIRSLVDVKNYLRSCAKVVLSSGCDTAHIEVDVRDTAKHWDSRPKKGAGVPRQVEGGAVGINTTWWEAEPNMGGGCFTVAV